MRNEILERIKSRKYIREATLPVGIVLEHSGSSINANLDDRLLDDAVPERINDQTIFTLEQDKADVMRLVGMAF